MHDYRMEDRGARLSALGVLATLCPPGDEDEIAIQIDLRDRLLSKWPTPILVEACMRLAQTWTWPKMPLPGDIDSRCRKVRLDCRILSELEPPEEVVMPLEEARQLLLEAESEDPQTSWEQLAHGIWKQALKARIKLGELPVDMRIAAGDKRR